MTRDGKIVAAVAALVGAASIGVGIALSRGRRRDDRPPPSLPPPPLPPSGGRRDPQYPQQGVGMSDVTHVYNPTVWIGVIAPYAIQQQIPLEFAEAALKEESDGNPCAIGSPEQYGPDGNPREMGILQFFNPDDLQLLKISGPSLRAYCAPEKVPYKVKDGKGGYRTVMGPSQRVVRLLTPDEMTEQATGTVHKIAQMRSVAAHYATAAGVTWPSDSIDFWRLVKLVHGLPGLVSVGLAHVAAHLGHPPVSWAEYRHAIESGAVHCDPNTEAHRGVDGFGWIFNNAEKATATMPGKAIA